MRDSGRRRAKRSLGQNFLVDEGIQRKIVRALEATPEDEVVEIGPGRGALTEHLVGTVRRLVLVEKDDALARELEHRFGGRPGVAVLHADILSLSLDDHVSDVSGARIVGNIPYNITSPILFHLLERPRPREIVVMVQEEVAGRLTARHATAAYGALAVGVQSVASVERLFGVGRGVFRPVPRVDSALVRIRPHAPPELTPEEEIGLRSVVRAAFQWRRKQMGKILRDHPDLGVPPAAVEGIAAAVGFRVEDRPERLDPAAFIRLAAHLP